MTKRKPEMIRQRRMAKIGGVLAIAMDPGEKVFDAQTGRLLGIVGDRQPVVHPSEKTVYLSRDDYEAARKALTGKRLPGLPGTH